MAQWGKAAYVTVLLLATVIVSLVRASDVKAPDLDVLKKRLDLPVESLSGYGPGESEDSEADDELRVTGKNHARPSKPRGMERDGAISRRGKPGMGGKVGATPGADESEDEAPRPKHRIPETWNVHAEIAKALADPRKQTRLKHDPLKCSTPYKTGCMTVFAAIEHIVDAQTLWAAQASEAFEGCFQRTKANRRQLKSHFMHSRSFVTLYPWDLQKCAERLCNNLQVNKRLRDRCPVRCAAIAFNVIQVYNQGIRGLEVCMQPSKQLDSKVWAWPSVHQRFMTDERKLGYLFDRHLGVDKAEFLRLMTDNDLLFVKGTVSNQLEAVQAKSRMLESVNLEMKEKCDGFLRLLVAKQSRASDVEDYAALSEHVKSWDELLQKYRAMIRLNQERERKMLMRKQHIKEIVEDADKLNIEFEQLFRAYRHDVKMSALMGTSRSGAPSAASGNMGLHCQKAAKNSICKKYLKSQKFVWTPTNFGVDSMSTLASSLVSSLIDTAMNGGSKSLNRRQRKCGAALQELACEITMPSCRDDSETSVLTEKIKSMRRKCQAVDSKCSNERKVLLGYRGMPIFQAPCSIAYAYTDRAAEFLQTGETADGSESGTGAEELQRRSMDWMERSEESISRLRDAFLEVDGDEDEIVMPSQSGEGSEDLFAPVIDRYLPEDDEEDWDELGYGADVDDDGENDIDEDDSNETFVTSDGRTLSLSEAEVEVMMRDQLHTMDDTNDGAFDNIFRRLNVDTGTTGGSIMRQKLNAVERRQAETSTLVMMSRLGDLNDRAFMAEQESRIINGECPEQIRRTTATKSRELNKLMLELQEATRKRALVEELVRFAVNRRRYMTWKMSQLRMAMKEVMTIDWSIPELSSDSEDKRFIRGSFARPTSLKMMRTHGIICAPPPFQLSFCSDVTWPIVDKSTLRDYWMSNTDADLLAKTYYESFVGTLADGHSFFCPAAVKSTICHMMFPMCSLKQGGIAEFHAGISNSNDHVDIRRPCNTLVTNVRESCSAEVVEKLLNVLDLNNPSLFSTHLEKCEGASWAALIATSREARHQKTVFKQYQVLRKAGYDDNHIVMMTPDNLGLYEEGMVSATPDSNGREAVILWDSALTRSRIESVELGQGERYAPRFDHVRQAYVISNEENLAFNVKVDYSGLALTAKNILSVLTGCRSNPTEECSAELAAIIDPSPHDRVMVFMSGHSDPHGMVIDQTAVHQDILYHSWFQVMLTQIIKKKKLGKEWMFFVSSCYSGRFFEGLPWDARSMDDRTSLRDMVWAITSSNTMLQSGTAASLSKSTTTMAEGVLRYMQKVFENDDAVASNADLDYMFEYVKLVVAMEGRGKDLTTEYPPPMETFTDASLSKEAGRESHADTNEMHVLDIEDAEEDTPAPPPSPRVGMTANDHTPIRNHSAREQLAYCAGFAPGPVSD